MLVCIIFVILGWSLSCTKSLISLSADWILAQEEWTSLIKQRMFIHLFSALWHVILPQLFWRITICVNSFPCREYYSNTANRKGIYQQPSNPENRKSCTITKTIPSEYSTGQRVSTITCHWTFQMTMTKVCVRNVYGGISKNHLHWANFSP